MEEKKNIKKQMISEYKERKIIGGIYQIKNKISNRFYLSYAVNLSSPENSFQFAQKTNTCLKTQFRADWEQYGNASFEFEILEKLEKKADQLEKDFREDLKILEKLWLEKTDLSLCVNHKIEE